MGLKGDKIYGTKAYRLFETLFKTPNIWLTSRRLGEMTGVPTSSVSVLMRRTAEYLKSEGLLEMKDDPATSKGRLIMFKGNCEKPEEEARLWYAKMLQTPAGVRKKQAVAVPAPVAAKPWMTLVQVDTATMEAVIRVPLSKLGAVLEVLR